MGTILLFCLNHWHGSRCMPMVVFCKPAGHYNGMKIIAKAGKRGVVVVILL